MRCDNEHRFVLFHKIKPHTQIINLNSFVFISALESKKAKENNPAVIGFSFRSER